MVNKSSLSWLVGIRLRLLIMLLTLVLLLSIWQVGFSAAENEQTFPIAELPEEARTIPAHLREAQNSGMSTHPKLDSALQELAMAAMRSTAEAREYAQIRDLRMVGENVQTRVSFNQGQQQVVVNAIIEMGGAVTFTSNIDPELQAWIPFSALEALAKEKSVNAIDRPAYAHSLGTTTGEVSSEGLEPLNAPQWNNAGQRGAGVKIAIIDSGFLGYPALLGEELPDEVVVKNFVDGEGDDEVDGTSKHGAACAEIIFDIAPEAQYYLLKIDTNLDLQEAVNYAISQGVDIISTSVGWYNLTPGDGSGQFEDLAKLAQNNGITWLAAAGNDRQRHWGGSFNDLNGSGFHEFRPGWEINYFGPDEDRVFLLSPGFAIRFFMRWNDWADVEQDYDLYLFRWNESEGLSVVASSQKLQEGEPGQTPTEDGILETSGSDAAYGFGIQRKESVRNVHFEVHVPQFRDLSFMFNVPERSLPNLADAPSVVTVGAVAADSPYDYQEYSAQGPTNGPGGAAEGGFPKPDLAAYTTISTESFGELNFDGTSTGPPHAAGAAALIKSANPCFSPAQVRDMLQRRAIDMGQPGLDTLFGHGRAFLASLTNENCYLVYLPLASGR